MKDTIQRVRKAASGSTLIGVNFLALAAAVTSRETVTIGDSIFEVDTTGTGDFVTSGNTAVDLSGGSTVAAEGVLTIAEPVTAEDTMTIGATTYTFKNGATAAAGEIGLGANEAATKLAIVAAINGSDGFNTANASVESAEAFETDELLLTAKEPGTVGNSVVTTETFTHVSNVFDAGTLGTATAGVDPTDSEAITAFAAAILADETLDAYAQDGGVVIVNQSGRDPLECSETLAGSGNAWQNTTTIGHANDASEVALAAIQSRAAVAAEVTAGLAHFAFGRPVVHVLAQIRTAAGVVKAHDGNLTVNGNLVTISNAGSTDFAATDVLTVVAGFAPQG